jgi:NAD(P)-dependent dehydrogenase (short-subunit alcohol dehydrogenase family)
MSRQILVTGAEERVRAVAEALSAAGCDCVTATDAPALTAVVDELGD